jgi:hypothetical protein
VCDAEIMFKILPFPDGLGEKMRANAATLGMMSTRGRDDPREVVITGVGLVSSLGEGLDANAAALADASALDLNETTYAPFRFIPPLRWNSTARSPRSSTRSRWSRGSALAPMPPVWRWKWPG